MDSSNSKTLQPGCQLKSPSQTYEVEKILGQGGFGISYLAFIPTTSNLKSKWRVAIKEFFPSGFCERVGNEMKVLPVNPSLVDELRGRFTKEAERISAIEHPNVIDVLEIFEANGTIYYVMEYADGGSLEQFKEPLDESVALDYIRPIAEAVDLLHKQRINHLDIKPDNILLIKGRPVLIDFGISKGYKEDGEQTSIASFSAASACYAPLEQCQPGGVQEFSPQTDIYSLAATLYRLLTGTTPPTPQDVTDYGLPKMPANVSFTVQDAIRCAMSPSRRNRPATIHHFLDLLNGNTGETCVFANTQEADADDGATRIISNAPVNEVNSAQPIIDVKSSKRSSATLSASQQHDAPKVEKEKGTSHKAIYIGVGGVLLVGLMGWGIAHFIGEKSGDKAADTQTEVALPKQPVENVVEEKNIQKQEAAPASVVPTAKKQEEPAPATTTSSTPSTVPGKTSETTVTSNKPLTAEDVYEQGKSAEKRGDYEAAATLYKKAHKMGHPNAMKAYDALPI